VRAAAVVAEGRRAEQAAAAIVALAWAAPAWTFGWAGCEALGLSSAWALVPAVLVAAGVLRGRRFDERACVARLEAALATEGALELALESERGRDLPARSAAAVHARVEERADATTVRGVALAGAPRSALVGLAVATFGLIALGVVRNVKVMTRGPAADAGAIARGPAAAELTPAERRALLEALREVREQDLADAAPAADAAPTDPVVDLGGAVQEAPAPTGPPDAQTTPPSARARPGSRAGRWDQHFTTRRRPRDRPPGHPSGGPRSRGPGARRPGGSARRNG